METQHQNRKQKNIQIEREKKRKRGLQSLGVVAVILVIVAAIGFSVWDNQRSQWIMTFGGDRIATSDFAFMMAQFNMLGDFDGMQELAMDELQNTLTLINRAEAHGVGLTAEEREQLTGEAAMQLQWMGTDFISPVRVAELFGTNHIQPRLMDIYVPADSIEIDPIEFASALVEYMDNHADAYATFEAKYVVVEDPAEATRIFLTEAENFDDLVREYSIFYEEEWGVDTLDVRAFAENLMLEGEELDIVLGLQNGERHVVQADDLFVVLYIYDRADADLEIVEESFRQQFAHQTRAIAFAEMVQEWRQATPVTINQRVYDTF